MQLYNKKYNLDVQQQIYNTIAQYRYTYTKLYKIEFTFSMV